jgi:rubrerythrin
MNKQIEEMAKEMCKHCAGNESPCSVAKSGNVCKSIQREAEALYTAGYRRQGENTDEVRHGHWLRYGYDGLQCSLCGAVNNNYINNNYCPNCGARMKGDEGK